MSEMLSLTMCIHWLSYEHLHGIENQCYDFIAKEN